MKKKGWRTKFKDAEVTTSYVTWNNVGSSIRYKLFNNQLSIDLKTIIDKCLKDAGITGFDTDKVNLSIPYNIDDTASGNSITLLIDKKRFHIRIPEATATITKQQKIGYDNTHPHRWNLSEWIKYIERLFWDYYGFRSVELNLRGASGNMKRGKIMSTVKGLLTKIRNLEGIYKDDSSVIEYLNWVFTNKGKNPLSIYLICCDTMVQEWATEKSKHKKMACNKKGLSKKWK